MNHVEMTCILCPVGCRLRVEEQDGTVNVKGNTCARGARYGEQELLSPMRVVTSSIRLAGSVRPLCPVKTLHQIPKSKIPEVLREIKAACVPAPVVMGQVLIRNIADTGVDLVATANR